MKTIGTVIRAEDLSGLKPQKLTIIELMVGGKTVHISLLRAAHLPEKMDTVRKVELVGTEPKELWTFKGENFAGISRLHELHGKPVISLWTLFDRDNNYLDRIIPLEDIVRRVRVKLGNSFEFMGDTDLVTLFDLKVALATELGTLHSTNTFEKGVLERRSAEKLRLIEEQRLNEQRQRDEKHLAKLARVEEINGRPRITVWSDTGKSINCLPVTKEELASVNSGTQVVLVTSYDLTNRAGNLIETFYLVKKGMYGQKPDIRNRISPVLTKKPEKQLAKEDEIEATGKLSFEIPDRGRITAFHFKGGDGILDKLLAKGLNSGTMVAIGDITNDGRYAMFCFASGAYTPAGHFAPIAQ